MLLFCGDLVVRGERLRELFARAGYWGESLVHQWSVANFADQVRENRRHELHGPVRFTDEEALRCLVAGRADEVTGIVTQFFPVSGAMLRVFPRLRFVASLRSGLQNVDTAAARAAGVTVYRNPGRNAAVVAEFTVALMLAACRGVARAHHALLEGRWFPPEERSRLSMLSRRRVGLVGLGEVGRRVAGMVAGFGCTVSAFDPYVADRPATVRFESSLDALLDGCDLVSLHARVTPETVGLVDAGRLRRIGPDGFLVNTARAELVDEPALVEALRRGELAGAALDVYSVEPLPADHPLRSLPTVTLTPHLAGSSRDAIDVAVELLASRLADAEPDLDWDRRQNDRPVPGHSPEQQPLELNGPEQDKEVGP